MENAKYYFGGNVMNQNNGKFYQVSTLQALALGFSKSVITVEESW